VLAGRDAAAPEQVSAARRRRGTGSRGTPGPTASPAALS